ncbi:MAG: hypothetical protein WC089_04335 [Candidatus Paceibacterota bacterium]
MDPLKNIESQINSINERNKKVEVDKAWETSNFRIFSVCLITYIVASFVLYSIGNQNFLLNALVPVVGYFLSTQSLPIIKTWWIGKNIK